MFLLIGFGAGALTGVPIGPANVAVIDAAYRHTLRRAISVGLGSAVGDCVYAAAGALGVTPVVKTYPQVLTILYAVSGVVLLIYGFLTARSQPVKPAAPASEPGAGDSTSTFRRKEVWSGFTVGLALIMLNPAAIVTWVVITTSMMPHTNALEGIAVALGVLAGSWSWFSLVAYLTHKGKNVLGDKAAWIPRIIGMALMIYAIWLLAKAVRIAIA
jgi:threonine/homoserine/homoserine lactone efflux protein